MVDRILLMRFIYFLPQKELYKLYVLNMIILPLNGQLGITDYIQRKRVENEKQNSTMVSKKACYLTLAANIESLSQLQKSEQRFPPVYLL